MRVSPALLLLPCLAGTLQAQGDAEKTAAVLIAQLQKGEVKERAKAAKALGRIDRDEAATALVAALKDKEEVVRHAAAVSLARLRPDSGGALRVLVDSLGSTDWYTRWQACLSLRALGPKAADAVPVLLNVAFDPDLDITREAMQALEKIGPDRDEIVYAYERALTSDLKVDRQMLLVHLDKAGRLANVLPWLSKEYRTNRYRLRDEAYAALVALKHDARPVFVEALADPSPRVRTSAALALGRLPHKEVVKPLLEAADDEEPDVRVAVVAALGGLDKLGSDAVPTLERALQDDDGSVQRAAIVALGQLGTVAKSTVPALVKKLSWPDRDLAARVNAALTRIGSPVAPVIVAAADRTRPPGKQWRVRLDLDGTTLEDATLYGRLLDALRSNTGGPGLVAALDEVLDKNMDAQLRGVLAESSVPSARELSAFLLGQIAREPAPALAALEKAAEDRDGEVRDTARKAIESLKAR